jgi:hypothetical protein
MRRIISLVAAAAVAGAVSVTVASAASAAATCSGGVFTGVNVSGGLVVTGACIYHDSTISGGVTVTSTGGFEIENSSVSGGVVVQAGGEFDVDHTLSSDVTTGNHSSISGGIKFAGKDLDLVGATVTGGTTISGQGPGFVPTICDSTLASLTVTGVTGTFIPMPIGDPGEVIQAGPVPDCPGNTLTGSLTVTNSHNVEIESNLVGGSVTISGSTLVELAANTIKGSAQCTNVTSATDGDAAPNTVQGSNNCP